MTIKEAISRLEGLKDDAKAFKEIDGTLNECFQQDIEALTMAEAALKVFDIFDKEETNA